MTRVEHDQSARAFGHEGNLLNASNEIENEVFLGQTVPSWVIESLEGGLLGFSSIVTSEMWGEYNQVRDSYPKQRIPTDLKLNNSKQGNQGQHRDLAYNFSNCA